MFKRADGCCESVHSAFRNTVWSREREHDGLYSSPVAFTRSHPLYVEVRTAFIHGLTQDMYKKFRRSCFN
jgi:hypothetical protein